MDAGFPCMPRSRALALSVGAACCLSFPACMRCVAAAADVEASSWSADSEVASRFAAPPWLLPMSVPLGDKVTREDDASTRSGDGETFHSDPLSVGDGGIPRPAPEPDNLSSDAALARMVGSGLRDGSCGRPEPSEELSPNLEKGSASSSVMLLTVSRAAVSAACSSRSSKKRRRSTTRLIAAMRGERFSSEARSWSRSCCADLSCSLSVSSLLRHVQKRRQYTARLICACRVMAARRSRSRLASSTRWCTDGL